MPKGGQRSTFSKSKGKTEPETFKVPYEDMWIRGANLKVVKKFEPLNIPAALKQAAADDPRLAQYFSSISVVNCRDAYAESLLDKDSPNDKA